MNEFTALFFGVGGDSVALCLSFLLGRIWDSIYWIMIVSENPESPERAKANRRVGKELRTMLRLFVDICLLPFKLMWWAFKVVCWTFLIVLGLFL